MYNITRRNAEHLRRAQVRLGFHLSIAGGFARVPERARYLGCETLQVFSRSPRAWHAQPIQESEAQAFRDTLRAAQVAPIVVHTPYLLSLGSADPSLGKRSADVLAEELKRAAQLGAQYVVTHLGGSPEPRTRVLRRIARRIDSALRLSPPQVLLLLENSAGAGSLVGASFPDLAEIISHCRFPIRLGICLDTAHALAAGHEVRTPEGLARTLAELDACLGLHRLRLLHGNDSKTDLGSHVDRHWHIGRGVIGLAGFRNILSHPTLQSLPLIMETPRKSIADDRRNMRLMKRLRRECQDARSGN
jgi:deoxyribonuclease-4